MIICTIHEFKMTFEGPSEEKELLEKIRGQIWSQDQNEQMDERGSFLNGLPTCIISDKTAKLELSFTRARGVNRAKEMLESQFKNQLSIQIEKTAKEEPPLILTQLGLGDKKLTKPTTVPLDPIKSKRRETKRP